MKVEYPAAFSKNHFCCCKLRFPSSHFTKNRMNFDKLVILFRFFPLQILEDLQANYLLAQIQYFLLFKLLPAKNSFSIILIDLSRYLNPYPYTRIGKLT